MWILIFGSEVFYTDNTVIMGVFTLFWSTITLPLLWKVLASTFVPRLKLSKSMWGLGVPDYSFPKKLTNEDVDISLQRGNVLKPHISATDIRTRTLKEYWEFRSKVQVKIFLCSRNSTAHCKLIFKAPQFGLCEPRPLQNAEYSNLCKRLGIRQINRFFTQHVFPTKRETRKYNIK